MILVCYMICYEHVIKGSIDFMSPSRLHYYSAKFDDHKHSTSADVSLICHVILQDYKIKESCELIFIQGSTSW